MGEVCKSASVRVISVKVIEELVAFFTAVHKADVNKRVGGAGFFPKLFTTFGLEESDGG